MRLAWIAQRRVAATFAAEGKADMSRQTYTPRSARQRRRLARLRARMLRRATRATGVLIALLLALLASHFIGVDPPEKGDLGVLLAPPTANAHGATSRQLPVGRMIELELIGDTFELTGVAGDNTGIYEAVVTCQVVARTVFGQLLFRDAIRADVLVSDRAVAFVPVATSESNPAPVVDTDFLWTIGDMDLKSGPLQDERGVYAVSRSLVKLFNAQGAALQEHTIILALNILPQGHVMCSILGTPSTFVLPSIGIPEPVDTVP